MCHEAVAALTHVAPLLALYPEVTAFFEVSTGCGAVAARWPRLHLLALVGWPSVRLPTTPAAVLRCACLAAALLLCLLGTCMLQGAFASFRPAVYNALPLSQPFFSCALQSAIVGGCRGVGNSGAGAPAGRLAWAVCSSDLSSAAVPWLSWCCMVACMAAAPLVLRCL